LFVRIILQMETVMDARKLVIPGLVLLGGAVLGRMVSVRTLLRGAMAGFTLAQAAKQSGLLEAPAPRKRTRAVQRAARKRPIQKKSRAA
jgi:hypothetical protein